MYSAGEFEPGSEALLYLHHRQGFKLVSDCNTNYLSGICLGLTLQIKFKSRFNWFIGKYTRRTVLPHRWILFASQSRHLVMGSKNRMSLTQALGLLRCRLQAIPGEGYQILSNTVYENNRSQYPFNAKISACWLLYWGSTVDPTLPLIFPRNSTPAEYIATNRVTFICRPRVHPRNNSNMLYLDLLLP